MQTLYYTTSNFIRHTDNIVDLSEYRRRLAVAQQAQTTWLEDEAEDEPVAYQPRPRNSARRQERRAALLDMWASMGVLAMTISFTLYVLCL